MRLIKMWAAATGLAALLAAIALNPPGSFRIVVWYAPSSAAVLAYLLAAAAIALPLWRETGFSAAVSAAGLLAVAAGTDEVRLTLASLLFAILFLVHMEYSHAVSRFRMWEQIANPESGIGKTSLAGVQRVLRRYLAASAAPFAVTTALVFLSLLLPRILAPVLPDALALSIEWRGVYGLAIGAGLVLGAVGSVSVWQSVRRRREVEAVEAAARAAALERQAAAEGGSAGA